MKINYDIGKKIELRYRERADIIHYEAKTSRPIIHDDVFNTDGITITLRTDTYPLQTGHTSKDYYHEIAINIFGSITTIKDPWNISTTASFVIRDAQKNTVFAMPTYDGRAPAGAYGGPTSIAAEKMISASGTSLTVTVTGECKALEIGRGDKVKILIVRD